MTNWNEIDYVRVYTNDSNYASYIFFDEETFNDYKSYDFIDEFTKVEEVIVDKDNCYKVWTYDNEYEVMPNWEDDKPYVFADANDYSTWNDVNNGDGHQNCSYREVIVVNGIEHFDAEVDSDV